MLIPFVGIVGIPEGFRGRSLELDLTAYTEDLRTGLGELVSPEDFYLKKFHTDEIALQILGRTLTRGEVGCSLGHLRAYSSLITAGANWGVIVEDDAVMIKPLDVETLSNFLNSSIPKVCCLYWEKATTVSVRVNFLTYISKRQKQSGFVRLLVPPTNTVAYAINRAAAHELVSANTKVSFTADWPIIGTEKIKFFRANQKHFDHSIHSSLIKIVDDSTGLSRDSTGPRARQFSRAAELVLSFFNLKLRGKQSGVFVMTIVRPLMFVMMRFTRRSRDDTD